MLVAETPPKVTLAALVKFEPLRVTDAPPRVLPDGGATAVSDGAGNRYVNPFVRVALCVSGFVTVTSTAPTACAAVVAVIDVASKTTVFAAATPPMVTVAPGTKFVPMIVTLVPPTIVPTFGESVDIVGAVDTYVNPFVRVAPCVSGFVTVTLTTPVPCAPVVAVIDVASTTTTLIAARPPMVTIAPGMNFVPVIVTLVPPSVVAEVGEMLAIVGAVDT